MKWWTTLKEIMFPTYEWKLETLSKSTIHYARRDGAEFCDDINCDYCRINKRIKRTLEMKDDTTT